jgi:hypothetical protein
MAGPLLVCPIEQFSIVGESDTQLASIEGINQNLLPSRKSPFALPIRLGDEPFFAELAEDRFGRF